MLNNVWFIACIWMGLALVASLISIRTGISVALVEILVGLVAGNLAVGFEGGTMHVGLVAVQSTGGQLHHILQSTEWTNFLALLGSGVLTFLAGAEIDPQSLKTNWRASLFIGVLRAIFFRLGAARGTNCRHRAFDDVSGGGLCSHDRGRFQRHGNGQDDSGCMFHYRSRNRARIGDIVCELQSFAVGLCYRHADRSVVYAEVDTVDHHPVWRDPR